MEERARATATKLGQAGLIPFCALPLVVWVEPVAGRAMVNVMASYTLAIICFLVGAWWGLALIRRSAATLVASNAVVIVAVAGHATVPSNDFLLLGAALILLIFLVEKSGRVFRRQPPYYARLRLHLTAVSSASLCLAWVAA